MRGPELNQYANIESEASQWPTIKYLAETINNNKVDDIKALDSLTWSEVAKAYRGYWCAQKIASLAIKTKTEWKSDPARWDALDALMGDKPDNNNNAWQKEKERIEKLSFWGEARGVVDSSDKVCFLNPAWTAAKFKENKNLITIEMLLAANPSTNLTHYNEMLPHLNKFAEIYQVNTQIRIAHFLAQVGHESGLKIIQENANYSAKRMRQIFGCKNGSKNYDLACDDCKAGRLREKLWTEERKYANNPQSLLSYVYGGRYGNGDEESGDGFKYRGRGLLQITFKDEYRYFSNTHNAMNPNDQKDFVQNPDLLISNLSYGVESAFIFWHKKSINNTADTDDLRAVTLKVNGGTNGLADRQDRLIRLKTLLRIP